MHWYALYTKPRCERVVSERLQAKGFETYLPTTTVDGSRGSRVTRPFFPCYLFVRLNLNTNALSLVRWTPGLRHIVSFDETPAVVPDEVIALIRERLAANFRPGDQETRRQGEGSIVSLSPPLPLALSQLEAIFEEALQPAERAWVLIRFLGRINKVQVAVEDLEPVGAAKVTR